MIWYAVVKHLAKFLNEYRLPDGTDPFASFKHTDGKGNPESGIYPGTKGNAVNKSSIEILWDTESGQSLQTRTIGEIGLFVDVVIRTDRAEHEEAYRAAFEAQKNVLETMAAGAWARSIAEELATAVKVDCTGIMSDGEISRPTFRTRMIFKIEWKKARDF